MFERSKSLTLSKGLCSDADRPVTDQYSHYLCSDLLPHFVFGPPQHAQALFFPHSKCLRSAATWPMTAQSPLYFCSDLLPHLKCLRPTTACPISSLSMQKFFSTFKESSVRRSSACDCHILVPLPSNHGRLYKR